MAVRLFTVLKFYSETLDVANSEGGTHNTVCNEVLLTWCINTLTAQFKIEEQQVKPLCFTETECKSENYACSTSLVYFVTP